MKSRIVVALALCLVAGARGQQAPAAGHGVRTSTDPARAAAVEQKASEIKMRAGSRPKVFFRGTTPSGLTILSGGNSAGDLATMHAERANYSLWVATVAKPSGAYLADARLRIVDLADGAVVLDRVMEGPWLMAALAPGRYEVAATYLAAGASKAQTLSNRVSIAKQGQRQVVLRFDSPAEVSPERDIPFGGNPFGAPAVKK